MRRRASAVVDSSPSSFSPFPSPSPCPSPSSSSSPSPLFSLPSLPLSSSSPSLSSSAFTLSSPIISSPFLLSFFFPFLSTKLTFLITPFSLLLAHSLLSPLNPFLSPRSSLVNDDVCTILFALSIFLPLSLVVLITVGFLI
jgi:hypothetical protein